MACPFQLGLSHGGNSAGDVCLLQHLSVWNFVLPVKEVAETPEMEVVELPLMPPVCSPLFAAIE